MAMHKIIVANWKMNAPHLPEWAKVVLSTPANDGLEIVVCPPFTQLAIAQMVFNETPLFLGAQDCHFRDNGAYTGDISADMLKRTGCGYVILGHCERRQYHAETNDLVKAKAESALEHGLTPIICIGESQQEREAGQAEAAVSEQLEGSVPEGEVIVAYEPVWAIGSGKTPSSDDISAMHAHIKKQLMADTAVIYGGSVNPANAAEILAIKGVDGALVGGASLDGQSFADILKAAP